jgi:putative membrane protein
VTRETENTVLLLAGISIVMITVSGAFTRYVKPGLQPWLAVSGLVLIALAAIAILGDIRRGGPHADDHTAHAHRSGLVWLLVVAVVVLMFVTPPALRPSAATPSVTSVASTVLDRSVPPLPQGDAPELSLPELLMRQAHDTTGSLQNHTVTVTGFVLNEPHGVDLGRIVIICCAADAQLARIHLRGPAAGSAGGLPDNTWLRIVGRVIPAARPDADKIPILQATSVSRIAAPPNPYAYPR